ncbi:MAG: hypothetical protein AB1656_13455 [Candidatus Omnitrophota bacterium]
MLPVNPLGDAAAAEAMVAQAAKTQRSDRLAQIDIFDRHLFLKLEQSRLEVQPLSTLFPSQNITQYENKPPHSQPTAHRREAPLPEKEERRPLLKKRQVYQPFLFDMGIDRVFSDYSESAHPPELGRNINVTA